MPLGAELGNQRVKVYTIAEKDVVYHVRTWSVSSPGTALYITMEETPPGRSLDASSPEERQV